MANTSTASGFNEVFKNSPFFTAGKTTMGGQLKLEPRGAGIVDVYSKLPWRSQTGPDPAELEIPYIMLTEFEIKLSGMLSNLNTLYTDLFGKESHGFKDIYKKLYVADPTNFVYKLPWLLNQGSSLMSSNNKWSDGHDTNPFSGAGGMISSLMGSKPPKPGQEPSSASKVGSYIGKLAGDFAKGSVAGVNGLDTVSYFEASDKKSISVSFPLYNTLDHKSAFENYNFVLLLTFQNTMTRTSLVTHIPPKIYEVRTGVGGIYMAAAYISNLNITNIGTTRLLPASEFGHISESIIIPEAYKVTFTLNDLLPASTQLLAEANGNVGSVNVIMPLKEAKITPLNTIVNSIFKPKP
jgi:hypothetical protein